MIRNYRFILSPLLVAAIIYWIFRSAMPQDVPKEPVSLTEFSTRRALEHVAAISKAPHYAGSENHEVVADYLVSELQKMGLETSIQEGYAFSDWGTLVKAKNILARIKGTGNSKALMLLSHYDCAVHSHGAADAGSGVATILEGLRTFLASKTAHKNDLIILFSDAEELGLNGAGLFVTQHPWAKDTGLILNFEARGSGGPSYMLMETNRGNAAMIREFIAADPKFPVSNSLMYSIYKMLPNDTDLTVFREEGKIQGFNFAFIDDHFNYHTAQDDLKHLSPETVEHQGTYLMPLLNYFSNAVLNDLESSEDKVYFNSPFLFISYPFTWNIWLLVLAFLMLVILLVTGVRNGTLSARDAAKGFLPFFASIVLSGAGTFLLWRSILILNPQYLDIAQGFTYNGHAYIGFFVFFTLAACFFFYRHNLPEGKAMSYTIAPVLIWILINTALVFAIPGGGFFIIPVLCSLIMLAYYVFSRRTSWILNLILSIPALIIFIPFITALPIGLGLKLLTGSALLTALLFTLLLPVFGFYLRKGYWSLFMVVVSLGFLIYAQLNSGYKTGKAKPNSLMYMLDADSGKAVWATYDKNLDDWTKKYVKTAIPPAKELSIDHPKLTYVSAAPLKDLQEPDIRFLTDTLAGNQRQIKIAISPNRKVNSYIITANENMALYNFKANGVKRIGQKGPEYQRGRVVLTYYVSEMEPLEMEFSIDPNTPFDMTLYESSFDLMEKPLFGILKRESWMMPTTQPLDGAVIIRKKIAEGKKMQ